MIAIFIVNAVQHPSMYHTSLVIFSFYTQYICWGIAYKVQSGNEFDKS